VVATGAYTRNSNNLKEAFNTVKAANPEVVMLGAVYTPCVEVVKMAKEANWHPVFVMNSGSNVDLFLPDAGADGDGALTTEVVPPLFRTDLPMIKSYLSAMKKFYPNERPGFVSLRGFLNAYVWVQGFTKAGRDLTREKFIDALESIKHKDIGLGKGMELSYSSEDHLGLHNVFFDVVKDGQVVTFNAWKALRKKTQ